MDHHLLKIDEFVYEKTGVAAAFIFFLKNIFANR